MYHERDFVAGEFITANIKNCVDRCRKALIILTPSFINSEWCRDEFVIAQSQDKAIFIKLKLNEEQEKQLSELLSKPENAPIKLNLETRTYLKWSGKVDDKEFWRWVAYLLPHKQPESSESFLNAIKSCICCDSIRTLRRKRNGRGNQNLIHVETNPLIPLALNANLTDENQLSNPPPLTKYNNPTIELNITPSNQEKNPNLITENSSKAALTPNSRNNSSMSGMGDDVNTRSTIFPDAQMYRHQSIETSHEDEEWFHPEFNSMRDSYLAMVNRTSMDGTYMVTNIPEAERSYGLYENGSYIILRGGAKSKDVTFSVIRKEEIGEGFVISGTDQVFPSLFELINHFQQNPLPHSNNTLSEPLKHCSIGESKRCRRCSSRDGS